MQSDFRKGNWRIKCTFHLIYINAKSYMLLLFSCLLWKVSKLSFTYIPYQKKRERSHWKYNFWNGAARYSIAFRMKVEIDLMVSSECFGSHIGTPTSYFFLTFMFKYELLLNIFICWIPYCHKTLDFPFHWIRGESWV